MELETSCGAVVFTREGGETRYVIIRSLGGDYGFPKGHVEGAETPEQTALREIAEETGLRPRLIGGFREVNEYPLPNKPNVTKRVIYFLAEYANQPIDYQREELESAELMTCDEAMAILTFDSTRQVLAKAKAFLEKQ